MYKQHDFYSNFNSISRSNDEVMKKELMMNELADAIINHRKKLLTVFAKSGIQIPQDPSDEQLVNAFLSNYDRNKQLVIGISYLIAHKNDTFSGAEGAPTDPIGAIATAVGKIAGTVGQGLANRGQKQQAKQDLIQTILNKRNPQSAAPKKKDNTLLYVGIGVAALFVGILAYKKYKS